MNRGKSVSLHSRYNPQGEAERYINSLSFNGKIRFFILIEPGLGYIIAPLKKKVPDAKIIALHAAEHNSAEHNSAEANGLKRPDSEWSPGTGISIQDFLEREIPDSEATEIRMLEWRPALAVYGGAYLSLVEETARFIKRADANTRTLNAFGKRWFRNFFKNLGLIRNVICPVPFSLPLLVTGAGPGLEEVIPAIREKSRRSSFFVLAVSSSAAALKAGGIVPDMVISTDGGPWAAFHLFECYRGGSAACPLAVSMTAALPSQCGAAPVLPISDGSFWQTLILKELGIPFFVLPQRGTVSAAALDLAFALTESEIFITGVDLANRDIQSHARPYSFDRFLEERACRLNPVYSQTYRRSSLLKAGGSYGIYASWFEKQLAAYPKRLHSLGNNNPLFSQLESPLPPTGGRAGNASANFRIFTLEPEGDISQKALAILEKALGDPVLSKKLGEELGSLLFPRGTSPSREKLIGALHSAAGGGIQGG